MKKITTEKQVRTFFLTLFALGALSGCASRQPLPESQKTDESLRQWESKVEVFDRRKDRKHTVDMDFLALGEERLRIDVSANFAVALAAAVVNDNEMTCILPRDKKYYKGSASREALYAALKVPLDWKWISAVLRDKELKGGGWICQKDTAGLPTECLNANEKRSVTWSAREGDRKKVKFIDPRFEFSFNLNEVPTKVQDLNKAFSLNVPESYVPVKP